MPFIGLDRLKSSPIGFLRVNKGIFCDSLPFHGTPEDTSPKVYLQDRIKKSSCVGLTANRLQQSKTHPYRGYILLPRRGDRCLGFFLYQGPVVFARRVPVPVWISEHAALRLCAHVIHEKEIERG